MVSSRDQVRRFGRRVPHPREGIDAYFLGVLRGIEVTGEADAADHQLAYLTDRGRDCSGPSTTARSQPSRGRPMLTGLLPSISAPQATTVASVGP